MLEQQGQESRPDRVCIAQEIRAHDRAQSWGDGAIPSSA
jgi:hypothetical protein